MRADFWKREIIIAVCLLGCGLFLLPLAIYWVGQQVVGEYSAESGVLALAEHIWSDLFALSPVAWVLVSSPYVVVQLARLARLCWRAKPVMGVTDPRTRS